MKSSQSPLLTRSKGSSTLLGLCLILAGGVGAAEGLVIQAPVRDLGRVQPGVAVALVFEVLNSGPAPLNILDLHPECGCVTARASRTRLAPGEAAELFVTFEPPPQEGTVRKVLEVFTDAQATPRAAVVLTADVRADLHLSANQVTFEHVSRHGGGLAEVRLEATSGGPTSGGPTSGGPVQVTRLRTSAGYLTVQTSQAGRDLVLQLRLDGAGLPRNARAGEASIDLQTTHPALSAYHIRVLWTADLEVQP